MDQAEGWYSHPIGMAMHHFATDAKRSACNRVARKDALVGPWPGDQVLRCMVCYFYTIPVAVRIATVHRRYPDARAFRDGIEVAFRRYAVEATTIPERANHHAIIGYGPTEDDAWADAASRL